jgi:hypothetical protein
VGGAFNPQDHLEHLSVFENFDEARQENNCYQKKLFNPSKLKHNKQDNLEGTLCPQDGVENLTQKKLTK